MDVANSRLARENELVSPTEGFGLLTDWFSGCAGV